MIALYGTWMKDHSVAPGAAGIDSDTDARERQVNSMNVTSP